MSEPTSPRGWRDAFGNRGGGGWGWARRRVRFGVFRVLGLVDDRTGDWLHFPHGLEFLAMSGMDVGRDSLSPISTSYEGPFPFRGELVRVRVTM